MSDSLTIFGTNYIDVTGFKAADSSSNIYTYIRPTGTLAITSNSSSIDVTEYATVSVDVAGGSGSGITVIESTDSHGGTIVDIYGEPIVVTLGTKNITENGTYSAAADSYDGYTSVVVNVPSSGGNEFIITVSKNNQTGYWEPDCTWADLVAAYSGGKTIAFKTDDPVDCQVGLTIINTVDSALDNVQYITNELFDDGQDEDYWVVQQVYTFNASGLTKEAEYTYYDPYLADATASDIVSGKTAYGQNGRITGSATARTSSDLSVSGNTITAPAGFYSSSASASVASGTEGTPSATKGTVSNHSVSVTPSVTNSAGYISGGTKTGTAVSVAASELVSGSETKTANGTYDVTNLASLVVNVPTGTARASSDVTVSGDTVSVPAGLYSSAVSKSVASGTAGTPTATKGTVSNHSVSVTPSVTNTTGYITGSTKTGTAVTVSASELVSGSETKSSNGTYDVTNLASLVVSIPIVTYYTGSAAPSAALGTNGDIYLQT